MKTHLLKALACSLLLGIAALPQTAHSQQSGPSPGPGSFGAAVLADQPVAFWQLNETNSPSTGTLSAYDYTGSGHNGTYGADALNGFNGVLGPQPPAYPYPTFGTNQGAMQLAAGDINSPISIPALNLNTNAVTIAMWINPGAVSTFAGLLMNRTAGGDAAGFGFGGTQSATTGMPELGYTWNTNNNTTYNFNSGLYPVAGIWQFVVLVIQPNSATIYLEYIDPFTSQIVLQSAVNPITHFPEAFSSGFTAIGEDVANGTGGDATRVFNGSISDVAVFNKALTADQVLALFSAGTGQPGFAPQITLQPQSASVIGGSALQLRTFGINGTTPFSYQWQLNGTNVNLLADNANFSGGNSNILTILNTSASDVGSYRLMITNSVGFTASSNAIVSIQSASMVGRWLDGSTAGTNLLTGIQKVNRANLRER